MGGITTHRLSFFIVKNTFLFTLQKKNAYFVVAYYAHECE